MIGAGKLAIVAFGLLWATGAQAEPEGIPIDPPRGGPAVWFIGPSAPVETPAPPGSLGADATSPGYGDHGAATCARNRRLLRPGRRHRPQRRPPPLPWRPPGQQRRQRQHLGRPHRHPCLPPVGRPPPAHRAPQPFPRPCRRRARTRAAAATTKSPSEPRAARRRRGHAAGSRRAGDSRRRAGDGRRRASDGRRSAGDSRRRAGDSGACASAPAPRLELALRTHRRRPQSSGRAPSRDQTAPRRAFPCSRPSKNRPFPVRQPAAPSLRGRRTMIRRAGA